MSGVVNDQCVSVSQATARLKDVFAITGRGTVALCSEVCGTVHVGDVFLVDQIRSVVTGIEMIRYSDPSKIRDGDFGVLIASSAEELRPFIGNMIHFSSQQDDT